jgi:hypothetical protein
MTKMHNFRNSLELSHAFPDAPWWAEVYRAAFPKMIAMHDTRNADWAQRAGIDRLIVLSSSKVIKIDEKVREKVWPDILLEFWSDKDRRIPGWIGKDLDCDFLAYAFVPTRQCFLLPFLTLRRAWHIKKQDWVKRYQIVDAINDGYVTRSVAVPVRELQDALRDVMLVTWGPAP